MALTPGNVADIATALAMLEVFAPARRLIADKAHDADRLRGWLKDREIEAVVPGHAARDVVYPLNPAKAGRLRQQSWDGPFCPLQLLTANLAGVSTQVQRTSLPYRENFLYLIRCGIVESTPRRRFLSSS